MNMEMDAGGGGDIIVLGLGGGMDAILWIWGWGMGHAVETGHALSLRMPCLYYRTISIFTFSNSQPSRILGMLRMGNILSGNW